MKASIIIVAGSVLFSMAASATGVIPVFDLDFTRSADETLKKLNINDGCIVDAPDPVSFTYCREGSTTLWKYQVLDLQQQSAIHTATPQSQMGHGQISVVEHNSPACADENEHHAKPAISCMAVLSLLALFLLMGLRYTYTVIRQHQSKRSASSIPPWQPTTEHVPEHHAMAKALGAFFGAAVMMMVYCSVCVF
ncbi:hypothetical protein [Pseudomonas fluorescens]|uniref:Transmembrane protein n=1 Tax=Pseudomonas fluorescens TaxID=294 RepID=A0A5E7G4Y2_PSEFL|nr:hypothetical protein [Pseudomonas fluorescens]VVO46769.1 hypothetical protein PS880_00082 [Pseudomonas fluorescens]